MMKSIILSEFEHDGVGGIIAALMRIATIQCIKRRAGRRNSEALVEIESFRGTDLQRNWALCYIPRRGSVPQPTMCVNWQGTKGCSCSSCGSGNSLNARCAETTDS